MAAYKGTVRFIVCLKLFDEEGSLTKEFNTTVSSLPVLRGLETGDLIVEQNPEVIDSILFRLNNLQKRLEEIEDEATGTDAIEALAECGIVVPAYQDGVFYTDANGAIYTL